MSCCDDPTAHQPSATAASALKALTTSGISVECPDPIVAAAMLEATQLTDTEREIILGVLGRDELLRRDQQLRVLQLKAELQNLRRKGALKPTTNLDNTGPDQDPDRYCRRCRVELGRVINRGSYCRACRLKVCKACREYSLRTTDWVCTVCKKQMEIQAASGEWMNEFVKRPKRRENRVCLPTADIIKRTIRRSWTISNPTPRWSAMRGSPELRPYNSLPRKQDINNYPSLVLYQANHKNQENSSQENPSPTYRRRSPRRTQSEDIYDDQGSSSQFRGTSPVTHGGISPEMEVFNQRSSRMNPLIKLPDGRPDIERRRSPMRRSNEGSSEEGSSKEDGSPKSKGILTPETARKFDRSNMEKRVSFESHVPYTRMSRPTPVLRTQSLIEGRAQNHLPSRYPAHHEDNSDNSEEAAHGDAHDSREENNPIELCEIEPFSGTVFRKMMVRRRRQNNARNISGSTSNCSTTAENGWRRGPESDLWDILLPEGDDYKLVFINSDGSSKEETSSREEDDNDSTSTASSFPIDECDWDYFEPGTRPAPVINWSSPFGSPRVYRRGVVESPIGSPLVYRRRMRESDTGTDEDNVRQDSGSPASSDSIFQPRIIPEDPSFESTAQLRNEKILEDTSAIRCVHSEDVSAKPCCHACGAPTQFIPIPVPVPIPFPVPTLWPPHEPPLMVFGEQRFRVLPRNLWPYLSQAALIWPTLNANGGTTDTTMPATTDRDTSALQTQKESDIVPPVVGAEEEITGYLECENRYSSSSDSSSDDSDNSGPRVRRMYNVSGTERHSDDALPSSNVSSDNDDNDGRLSHSSVREDDMTSSGTDDTDSDDTGTVADQKSKRFSRIFVVNKNLSSSSNSCSSSSNTDTSDNDTDTELDCTVVLTNVKQLEEERDDVCDSKSSDKDTKKAENEYYFSSPGLSDVSAESVNSSDVDNNDLITKDQPTDDTRKKKVCFDDTDAVEKETINDKVAVIKLNKRDIEAINKEKDLPFGNEFKLIQDEHFKINKDEVDDAVNRNKEITETAVTFSLSEGNINKSEEDNKTHDNIEAASDENVINVEEKTRSESLTKEHLDVVEFSGTTEKAVNDDNKGKTNNKTVLSACSTIQANILFDDQHNENLNLIISPGDDDLNIQNEQIETTINEIFSDSSTNNLTTTDDLFVKNNKDFDTDNLDSIIDTHFLTDDYFETFSHPINETSNDNDIIDNENDDETTISALNLTGRRINDNEDIDTRHSDKLTESAGSKSNDYLAEDTGDNNKDSDVETKDKFNLIIPNLTVENNEVIDTKSFEKLNVFSGTTTDESADDIDTTDNEGNDFMDTLDMVQVTITSPISNLELKSTINDEDVEDNIEDVVENISNDHLKESEKYGVAEELFRDTLTTTPKLNKDLNETFDENDRNQKAKEDMETLIDGTITSNKLDDTDHLGLEKHEDVMNLDDGVVSTSIKELEKFGNVKIGEICDKNIVRIISNDRLEESEIYEVADELFSDTLTTIPKLNKDLNETFDENDKDQNAKEDMETLIDVTITLNKLDDTDHTGLEKHEDVMNLDDGVVSTSIKELEKFGDVEIDEICDKNIVRIISNDRLEESEKYEVVKELFSDTLTTIPKLDKDLNETFDENNKDQNAKEDMETLIVGTITSNKLDDTDHLGLEKHEDVMNLDDGVVSTSIKKLEKFGDVEIDEICDKNIVRIISNDRLEESEKYEVVKELFSDTLTTIPKLDKDLKETFDENDRNQNAKEDIETLIDGTVTLNKLDDTDYTGLEKHEDVMNLDDGVVSTSIKELEKFGDVERGEICDENIVSTGLNEKINKIISKSLDNYEKVDEIFERNDGALDLNLLATFSKDETDEEVDKFEISSRKLVKDEKLDDENEIDRENDTIFDINNTIITDNEIIETVEEDQSEITIGENKIEAMVDKELTNIDEKIFEDIDKLETIAASNLIDTVINTDSESNEYNDDIDLAKYETISNAKTVEELPISQKTDTIALEFLETTEILHESQEKAINDNVDDYIITEYDAFSLAVEKPQEISVTVDNINVTDNEYSSLDASERTEQFIKLKEKTSTEQVDDTKATEYETDRFSSTLVTLTIADVDKTSEYETLSFGEPEVAHEKKSNERAYDSGDIEYRNDVLSSTYYDATNNVEKIFKPEEKIMTSSVDDDVIADYEFEMLTHGTVKKISTIDADDEIEIFAHGTLRYDEELTKLEDKISDSKMMMIDDVTDYEFVTLSSVNHAIKNAQIFTEPPDEISIDQSTENVVDENVTIYEFAKHSSDQDDLQRALKLTELQDVISTDDELSLSAPKTTPRLSKSQEKTDNESNDKNITNDNNSIEYALSSGTRQEDESTENVDDKNVTIYEFAKHSSAHDDLQMASKVTKIQDVISTDDKFSLGSPKTTPRLSKSQEEANTESNHDNSTIENEYNADGDSIRSQTLTEALGKISTDNTDNVIEYKFAILSSAQEDWKNAQKFTKPQEEISTDNAEKDIVTEHEFDTVSLGTPKTTQGKSEEQTSIESTDDNNAIEYALSSGTRKEDESTENVDDENVTMYKYSKHSSAQHDLQRALKLAEHQDVMSTDDELSLSAPKTTPGLSKSQEKANNGSNDENNTNNNNAIEYALSSGTRKEDESTENFADKNVTIYEFAKQSSAQDDLQIVSKLTELQDVISTDDEFSLGAPKTTPRLSKSQEEANTESNHDNSTIENEYNADGDSIRSQTLTEALGKISTDNTDNVIEYKFAILSSAQEDWKNAQKFTKPQEEISTDNAEKDIVTEHEFNTVSLGTPKTTQGKSEEQTSIESTDDNNAIEYALSSGTRKEDESTENVDDENVTMYKYSKHSSAQHDLQRALKLAEHQDVMSTDDELSLSAPKTTPRLSKSQEKANNGSNDENNTNNNNAIEYALSSGTRKEHESTENFADENVTIYEFAKQSSAQDDLQIVSKLTELQDVISTDDEFSLGAPKTTPRLSKSQGKANNESNDDNSTIEYDNNADSNSMRSQTLTEALGKIATENTDDDNVAEYKFTILSSAQDDLKNAQKFTEPPDEISTDNAEKYIVTEHEFNIVSLGTPKKTQGKSEEETSVKSTDDNNVIEYALSSVHGTQKEDRSTENVDDEKVTVYEFAKHFSAHDDLEMVSKVAELQDVISTDDELSLSAPKATPRLIKFQGKANNESYVDNSTIEYDNNADSDSIRSQTLTEAVGKISNENTDDDIVTEYQLSILSSAQDDLKNAQKFTEPPDEISTDNVEKCIVTDHEFNIVSLGTPKTTQGTSEEQTGIKSTDDYNAIEYALSSVTRKEDEGTENVDYENVTLYEFAKQSSAQEMVSKVTELQDVMNTDDTFPLSAPKTTPRLSKSHEKANIESNDDNSTIEYEYNADGDLNRYQTLTKTHEKISAENSDDENVTEYKFSLSSTAQEDLKSAQEFIKPQEEISTDNAEKDIATNDENDTKYESVTLPSTHADLSNAQKFIKLQEIVDIDNVTEVEFNTLSLCTPRMSKTLEKTNDIRSDVIEYENDTTSSAYGISKTTQKLTRSQEKINTDEALEFATLPLAESASETTNILNKIQDKANTEIVDYKNTTDDNTCSSTPAQVLGKLQEKIITEHTDDKNVTESSYTLPKFELKSFDTEEINIFEENDKYGETKNDADKNVVKSDYTLSSELEIPEEIQRNFTKPQDQSSPERKTCIFGESVVEINKEFTNDEETKDVIHSAALDSQKHQGENINKESDKFQVTPKIFELCKLDQPRDSFEKFTQAASPGVKFELKPFDTEEINIFEETGETKNVAEDYVLEYDYTFSSVLDIPKKTPEEVTKSQETFSITDKSAVEINKDLADDEKFTRVAFEDIKFELKPFNKEEINIFEENDDSENITTDDYALEYDYTISSALGISKKTSEEIAKSHETISSGRNISMTDKSAVEINKDLADDEKFTRAAFEDIKFELKPFNKEEINIFEENDYSENMTTDDYALEYDYTFSSALGIPKNTSEEITKSHETISSGRNISMTDKTEIEINKDLADDEKFTRVAFEDIKFELKPFNKEEINIFEENDDSENITTDDYALEYDDTFSSALGIPKIRSEEITKSHETISSGRNISMTDKSAIEINKELAHDQKFKRAASAGIKFELKPFNKEEINIFEENDDSENITTDDYALEYDYTFSSALGIPKNTSEEITKSHETISSGRNISMTDKTEIEINKDLADDEKFTRVAFEDIKFELKPFNKEEINIFEENDDSENITTDDYALEYDDTFSSALGIPKIRSEEITKSHETISSGRNISMTDKSAIEINKELAHDQKFKRAASAGIKFELKPFNKEEINIFEENDDSENITTDDYALEYDYTFSSALGIPKNTSEEITKSHETISSGRNISMTDKTEIEINKDLADDEKFTRVAFEDIKFELKPFNKEEINIFEENDDSENITTDDYALEYDDTFSSALGIPKIRSEEITKSHETISSGRNISMTDKSAIEINKELAHDQKFKRAASAGIKFELKPFNKEEINIFEENDDSENITTDDYALEYDYTFSSALGIPKNTSGEITKSHETISSGRNISMTDKSAIEINKELAHDQKFNRAASAGIKFELKPFNKEEINIFKENDDSENITTDDYALEYDYTISSALGILKKTSEEIAKSHETISSGLNISMTDKSAVEINKELADDEKSTRVAFEDVKFEIKPFNTKEINISEENDDSENITTDDYALEYDYTISSALGIPKKTSEEIAKSHETISSGRNISMTDKSALEINKELAHDQKFNRAASAGIKFELKPFNTEEINIFEENDDSDDYALEYNYSFSSAMGIPKKTQGKMKKNQEIISSKKSYKSADNKKTIKESSEEGKTNSQSESPGIKFELKPFNVETISIFEEIDKSGKPVALKDLDIVKNKQDLNYSECSNRTVVYSSFENNVLDISRRHEIIQSFDKTGRVTDCTVDIKSDDDDDEDTVENIDKINLGQTFKFTLRSYGEEEKNIKDSKKVNVLEKIFKKKIKSEKDSPPQQQEIDRLINQMVEAISSEYPTDSDTDNVQLMDVVLGGETPVESAGADDQRALSEWNEIRSIDAVNVEGKSLYGRNDGVQPGAIVCGEVLSRHAARYTSLVMITQDPAPNYQQVSVVTSDTTTLVPGNDVVVRHTNWQEDDNKQLGKKRDNRNQEKGTVTVITGGDTLSAFEEGLADDDSWVENLSHDEEDEDEFATNSGTEDSSSGEEVTLTCSAAIDQEEDLRGYHRAAIDFTLHTIVEESCEESEVEQNVPKKKERPASATDLEKYFFFGLGDGMGPSLQSNREDAYSETSSIYSEGMESLGSEEVQTSNDNSDPAELASSRLEKYFLSGFMGFTAERKDSDGSVGSDSEGRPSPEQRRKRLVRARGTGRSHSSSLDNLDNAISEQTIETQMSSEHSSSSDSENYDDANSFEKPDGQFDTVKRKKNKKHKNVSSADESKNLETTQEIEEKCSDSDEDGNKTPQPEAQSTLSNLTTTKNQQSRDSGFVGSCDDLLREQRDNSTPDFTSVKNELIKTELEDITEEKKIEEKSISVSTPPATSLTRKDSFNNWSSDEETNLMMCKMRQFFKTMVANSQLNSSSKPSTPTLSCTIIPLPSPRAKRCKPPQLVYFENELTRLMKTVPGIREDQVREIVEYLSSEDTWSDSYDSSDYTSSDLEITTSKTVLQQQISDSCKQIINKFDNRVDDEGDEGDGGIIDESHGLNKETAFVYQKLVASFEKMAAGENSDSNISKVVPHSSPPLIAKVMHHIGSRLVALMHEVSSGESHASNSPKTKHYHRRLQHKISSASSTTTEDDCPEGAGDILGYEEHVPYNLLPRSRSHDLLVGEARVSHQSISGVSDITEEKEASDCERFSWRGSFESALLATDSRNRLSLLGGEASALAIAAKRRSAGDLLFSNKSLSREQLDRVRSCGSIGGANSEDKLWVASAIRPNRRRSSVPDATCGSGGSADGEDEDEDIESRSTLPRSLQGGTPTTNSLPRLPTTVSSSSIQKSQSHHVLSQNVKSARYRPPGFNRLTSMPKRAVSAPGLQPSHQRRGRRSQQNNVPSDLEDANDLTPDKAVENNRIVERNVLREWEDVLKYRVVTLLDESETTVSLIDSEEAHLKFEEIIDCTEQKQKKFDGVQETICNVQDDEKFDNQQEINDCSFESDSNFDESDKKMEKEYQYQPEEMIKSDDMATLESKNGPYKQEKNDLPNLDEFHVILETMSTVCAVEPSTNLIINPEDERFLPEVCQSAEDFDGENDEKYVVQVNTVQAKESSKPSITISSTISKSVPEISKSSKDGNNELPLPHKDEAGVSEAYSSPSLASPRNGTKSATTSPVTPSSKRAGRDWHHEEDLDRIVGLHGRASLSTLGARSDSMASVYSGAGEGRYGSVAVRGQVEFGLQYNYKAGALEIQIKQCKDLAPVDTKRNRSDPYVKVYLLPDKSKSGKRKTKVKKHTLNPVFDECLKFHISLNGLESRTLWLTVWHSDMFGRNDFLGEVMMTLENKVFDDPTPKWYNLQERTEPFEDIPLYRGDVIVCLKFVPPDMTIQKKGKRSRGALHVLIKEAKALTAVKANGTSDPFCKSYLLPDKGRSSKQKTPIARRTTNPVWNYTFVYDDVSLQELAERCLELTVWDHDRLASNEFLGGVRFSLGTGKHYGKPVDWMDASGREMSLWKNMLEKPNFWVEGSLSLRSSLESRGS